MPTSIELYYSPLILNEIEAGLLHYITCTSSLTKPETFKMQFRIEQYKIFLSYYHISQFSLHLQNSENLLPDSLKLPLAPTFGDFLSPDVVRDLVNKDQNLNLCR